MAVYIRLKMCINEWNFIKRGVNYSTSPHIESVSHERLGNKKNSTCLLWTWISNKIRLSTHQPMFWSIKSIALKFCVNFRKLNTKVISESCNIPRVHKCFTSLFNDIMFSKVGVSSGKWKVRNSKEDDILSAFKSNESVYQLLANGFGRKETSETYEAMAVLLLTVN